MGRAQTRFYIPHSPQWREEPQSGTRQNEPSAHRTLTRVWPHPHAVRERLPGHTSGRRVTSS